MASPVDTSVKFFREDFPGAPALTGAIGAGNSVLKACLVTGFGLRTATSVVVASGIATVTLPSEALNPNLLDSVILVAGVTDKTTLNGEQRVTAANTTTLKFPTAAADGTASGTITIKTAPAGWAEPYSKTNVSVYQSTDVVSTKVCLRVDDTAAYLMRVVGYESMSDVDTGLGAFPTPGQISGGGYWGKRHSSGGTVTATPWDLFADGRFFSFCPRHFTGVNATYISELVQSFGDYIAARGLDPFAALLTCGPTSTAVESNAAQNVPFGQSGFSNPAAFQTPYAPRATSGLGSAVLMDFKPYVGGTQSASNGGRSGADPFLGAAPSAIDGKVRTSAVLLTPSSADTTPRGDWPGAAYIPQSGLSQIAQRGDRLLPTTGALAGRKLYVVQPPTATNDTQTTAAGLRGAIDITGPWR